MLMILILPKHNHPTTYYLIKMKKKYVKKYKKYIQKIYIGALNVLRW